MLLPEHQHTNSLNPDGSRKKIYPADVDGRFHFFKNIVYPILMAIFFVLPWIEYDHQRLLLLDIQHRKFFIFGLSLNAQDIYLLFFLLTGAGFTLFFITALFGRVFCGWLCPQTVFLEGLFRKIERKIDGTRSNYFKEKKKPLSAHKISKFILKNTLYVLVAFMVSVSFVLVFVPTQSYHDLLQSRFSLHPQVCIAIAMMSFLIFFNYTWFREQLCLIVCPYGRFQSILSDDDSLVIGYDKLRGEPRGKIHGVSGDCIDCGRCVIVCPTGIDIRNGLQLECVGCANCIDACNDMMKKINRPPGLIRYDSLNGLEKKMKRIFRPRIYIYIVLFFVGIFVFGFAVHNRTSFEANLLRPLTAPYIINDGMIQNQLEIHLFNKSSHDETYKIIPTAHQDVEFVIPIQDIHVQATKDFHIPLFVKMPESKFAGQFNLHFEVQNEDSNESKMIDGEFIGPTK